MGDFTCSRSKILFHCHISTSIHSILPSVFPRIDNQIEKIKLQNFHVFVSRHTDRRSYDVFVYVSHRATHFDTVWSDILD